MFLLPLRQTACVSPYSGAQIFHGVIFQPLSASWLRGLGSTSGRIPVPAFQCPAEGGFHVLGERMATVQKEAFGGWEKWWGEPATQLAPAVLLPAYPSSLTRGVC